MTSLSYEDIFSDFLGSITDYDFPSMDESVVYSLMSEYLHKALSRTYIRRLFSSIELDDEIQLMKFAMKNVVDEDSDVQFVKNILSEAMVIEWLEPQVDSKVNLSQFFGGKEQKFYSQSNHIAELRGVLDDANLKVRKEIRDRGYVYNSYLGGS